MVDRCRRLRAVARRHVPEIAPLHGARASRAAPGGVFRPSDRRPQVSRGCLLAGYRYVDIIIDIPITISSPVHPKLPALGALVRELRTERRWTQAELGRHLGLSQSRLSEIEQGRGSFTAEAFLTILQLFNVGVDHFGVLLDRGSAVQNALARHGAKHLMESRVLVPTSLDEPMEAVWEVLRRPESPRHIAALAPVFLQCADDIALPALAERLERVGRGARLGWLVESILRALATFEPKLAPSDRRRIRRARLVLQLWLQATRLGPPPASSPPDLLDASIRSAETACTLLEEGSAESKKWRIATALQPGDFVDALEAARAGR